MPQLIRHQAWIVLAGLCVFFVNLGVPQLWDEDEPKNAQCAREMLLRGDWIVPTFNEQLRYDKPVLVYWLMISAYKTFGDNEFAARFWSAVLAIGTTLLTYHLGRLLFRPQVGLWAGLCMTSSLMFVVAGRAATPDSTLIFCTTLAMLAFVRATWGASPTLAGADRLRDFAPKTSLAWAGVYAAMGLGALAKGPVAVVLPGSILGLYLLCVRYRVADGTSQWEFPNRSRRSGSAMDSVGNALRGVPRTWIRRCLGAAERHGGRSLQMVEDKLIGFKCQIRSAPRPARNAAGWLAAIGRTFSPRACWQVLGSMRPLTGLAVFSAVVLPWYVGVGVETGGDWLWGFLGTHNVGRFLKPMEGHRGPVVYYLFAIALGFFPWSWFLLPSLLALGKRIRRSPEWAAGLFVACWAGFYVGFFSLARTKLPSYVLPAYPALALLTAVFIDQWVSAPRQVSRWMPATGMAGVAIVGAAFLIAFPLAAPYVLPGEEAIGWIGASLLVGGLAALAFARRGSPRRAAIAMAVASVAFATGLFGFASVRASRGQNSASLIAFLRQTGPAPLRLATFDYNAPSLVFYARQPVGQFYQSREAARFFAMHGHAYLITRAECLERLRPALPADVKELMRQPRFLRQGEELVVLGRPARMAQSKRQKPL